MEFAVVSLAMLCLVAQCTGKSVLYITVINILKLTILLLGSCCKLEYIRQPPNTLHCSPYNYDGIIETLLECVVKYQTNEFEIRWFRENTTGAVEDLGLGDPNKSLGSMHWFSRYHDSDFFNQQYNPSYLGKYWCQVINTTADPDQPLMRSNVFTLLAPENYTNQTCSGVQWESNITCAHNVMDCSELSTTLPDPATTLPAPITTYCKIKKISIEIKRM